ncbi:TPA: phosphorylcholine transferase LicD [Streptococcus suis]
MDRNEFLEEVRKSSYYRKDFEQIFEEFKSYQDLILNALREFHKVCVTNSIPYQLAYGSLLGAVRDNGQIPWDYDVDVFVPYSKKEELIEALKNDLNDEFYFYCPEVDENCRHYMMRIAPKGYSTELFHLDVFYLIGMPEESEERKKFSREVQKLAFIRYYKMISLIKSANSFKGAVKIGLFKLRYLFRDVERDYKKFEKLCSMYGLEESSYATTADIFATWYEIPTKNVLSIEKMQTLEGEFCVPTSYKHLLSLLYGDYLKVPALENRIKELLKNHSLQSKNIH